jgi:hypothetical protein
MTKLEKIIYDASFEYERKVFDEGRLSDERERAKIIASVVLPLIEDALNDASKTNFSYRKTYGQAKSEWLSENITE